MGTKGKSLISLKLGIIFSVSSIASVGVKVRNMKMDLNIYGTWRRVTFEKLIMKIYDFCYLAK